MLTFILQLLIHLGVLDPGVHLVHAHGYTMVLPGEMIAAPNGDTFKQQQPRAGYVPRSISIARSTFAAPESAAYAELQRCRDHADDLSRGLHTQPGRSEITDGPSGPACLIRLNGLWQAGVQLYFAGDSQPWVISCDSDGRDRGAERACRSVMASFRWDASPSNLRRAALPSH